MKMKVNKCFSMFVFVILSFTAAVISTLALSPIFYRPFIPIFKLEQVSGLQAKQLIDSFKEMVDYLIKPQQKVLSLTYFSSSDQGLQHFSDVKFLIFMTMLIMLVSFLLAIPMIKWLKKKRQHRKLTSHFLLARLLPIILLLTMIIAFDKFFIFFHQILFRNNYWLFDPLIDPVITILPQEFFMAIFIMTILIYEIYLWFLEKIIQHK